jgi:starch synthase
MGEGLGEGEEDSMTASRPSRRRVGTGTRPRAAKPAARRRATRATLRPGLHVAMVAPEIAPFARTGGLGDVLGALPQALEGLGARVSLIMPAYRTTLQGGRRLEDTDIRLQAPVSNRVEEAALWRRTVGKAITLDLIRADGYFGRDHLYGGPDGDYPDNAERFVFLCRAALETLRLDPPHILHAHDWQSALAITLLKADGQRYPELAATKTVLTVHNAGYQGIFWHLDWHLLNLDWRWFTPKYLEFYGKINLLKGGLVFADAVTTVSPTYAEELKTPEQGSGLEGVFQERAADLYGILNGADYDVWSPEADAHIAQQYGPQNLMGKLACKADLQRSFGLLEDPQVPVVGMVTRLAAQKGMDLLEDTLGSLLSRDLQFVLLGTGERRYMEFFEGLQARYPGKVGVRLAFDDAVAHKITAGADIFLMPSRYEPGGLSQIYSMKYGTVPVVRATGGLKDTVEEFDPATGKGNGFLFGPYEGTAFLQSVERALSLFRREEQWAKAMQNAMAADFSWGRSAQTYLDLYQRLLAR